MKSTVALSHCFLWGLGALENDDWEDFAGLTVSSSSLVLRMVWECAIEYGWEGAVGSVLMIEMLVVYELVLIVNSAVTK